MIWQSTNFSKGLVTKYFICKDVKVTINAISIYNGLHNNFYNPISKIKSFTRQVTPYIKLDRTFSNKIIQFLEVIILVYSCSCETCRRMRKVANYPSRQHGKNREDQWAGPARRGTVGRLGNSTGGFRGPPVPPDRIQRSARGIIVGNVLTPSPGIGRHSLERFYKK